MGGRGSGQARGAAWDSVMSAQLSTAAGWTERQHNLSSNTFQIRLPHGLARRAAVAWTAASAGQHQRRQPTVSAWTTTRRAAVWCR
jgi:hypothetical protein